MILLIKLLMLLALLLHFGAGNVDGQMQSAAARAGNRFDDKHLHAIAGATFTYDEMISGSISGLVLDSASIFNARKTLQSHPTPFSSFRVRMFASTTFSASGTPGMSFANISVAGEGHVNPETRRREATARAALRLEHRLVLWRKPERGAIMLAGFADAGHVWSNSMSTAPINRTKIGSGIGLLLAPASHPTRALRIDFTVPLGTDPDSRWKIRLGIQRLR